MWSATTVGVDAVSIQIETHVRHGLPKYRVVGLPQGAVKESLDRVWSAISSCDLPPVYGSVTINLAPADLKKDGAGLDLPMAIGLLAGASSSFNSDALNDYYILGELALDGCVRPVRGVLSMALEAEARGFRGVIVPKRNADEAAAVSGLAVYGVDSLEQALSVLRGGEVPHVRRVSPNQLRPADVLDLRDVSGQRIAKRAVEVAAAGGHNLLFVGSPGSGKTMLARRLVGLLPELTDAEAVETMKIYSIRGLLNASRTDSKGLIRNRPYRSPHHTISYAGLCGGGSKPRPGEISLAHNGVLFLDELPEFKRSVLEVLREPLEEGRITLSRSQFSLTYPARFMLVASMNPCPCGYLNSPVRDCTCSPPMVHRYLSRISGPLLDRIDIHIEVAPVEIDQLGTVGEEDSSTVRARVFNSRAIQERRFAGLPEMHCNAQMDDSGLRKYCTLNRSCGRLVKAAVRTLGLSARAYSRILKVARTIADLNSVEAVAEEHVAEAIQYRSLDRTWI